MTETSTKPPVASTSKVVKAAPKKPTPAAKVKEPKVTKREAAPKAKTAEVAPALEVAPEVKPPTEVASTPEVASAETPVTSNSPSPDFDLAALLEVGAHFGHQTRRWHPAMKQYIYMEKDGVHIFDLAQTAAQLKIAYEYAYDLGKKNKTLVFVGTKRQARDIIKSAAEEAGAMYITSRWLGGLLTNWEQVSKSLKRMIEIETGLTNDAFKGYTKFERVQMEKEQGRLMRFFSGIKNLKTRPDALFVVDPGKEKNAVTEANMIGVPIIAVVDSNTDPRVADVVIPANDDALTSIEFVVKAVADGYKAGRAAR